MRTQFSNFVFARSAIKFLWHFNSIALFQVQSMSWSKAPQNHWNVLGATYSEKRCSCQKYPAAVIWIWHVHSIKCFRLWMFGSRKILFSSNQRRSRRFRLDTIPQIQTMTQHRTVFVYFCVPLLILIFSKIATRMQSMQGISDEMSPSVRAWWGEPTWSSGEYCTRWSIFALSSVETELAQGGINLQTNVGTCKATRAQSTVIEIQHFVRTQCFGDKNALTNTFLQEEKQKFHTYVEVYLRAQNPVSAIIAAQGQNIWFCSPPHFTYD